MNIDQQIKMYEDRITHLEQTRRNLLLRNNGPFRNDNAGVSENAEVSENDLSRISLDLDENYQQMTILKIRKMMGFIPL